MTRVVRWFDVDHDSGLDSAAEGWLSIKDVGNWKVTAVCSFEDLIWFAVSGYVPRTNIKVWCSSLLTDSLSITPCLVNYLQGQAKEPLKLRT